MEHFGTIVQRYRICHNYLQVFYVSQQSSQLGINKMEITSSTEGRKPLKLVLTKAGRKKWASRYMTSNELLLRQTPIRRSTVALPRLDLREFENQQDSDDEELLVPMPNQPKYDDQDWVEDNQLKNGRENQGLTSNMERMLKYVKVKIENNRECVDDHLRCIKIRRSPLKLKTNFQRCVDGINHTTGYEHEHSYLKREK